MGESIKIAKMNKKQWAL